MPESNDQSPTPKNEETTPPSFLHECRQFLHRANGLLEDLKLTFKDMKDAKERGVDWWARGMAALSLAGVIAIAVLRFKEHSINQNQEVNVHERENKSVEEGAVDFARSFAEQDGVEP